MNTIIQYFSTHYGLATENLALLTANMTEVKLSKGEVLIKEGEIHRSIYFIEVGAMRSYYINKDGKEVTHWFGFERDVVVSIGNFVNAQPSLENIEALEDSILWRIDKSTLLDLYETNLELANFGRKLAEQALLEMEEQILLTQFTDAKSRYQKLIAKFPQILHRVKLGHISSYLGITQVTLSRIRSTK